MVFQRLRLIASLLMFSATAAGAAPLPDFVKDTIGDWLVVTDDGKPGCRILLKKETLKGGWRANPAADCASRLPLVGHAVAWNYDGGVRLLNPEGKILLDFQEDESTLMKTSFERKPVFFIVRAPAGVDRAPFAPALVGAWLLGRTDGSASCALTISRAATDEDAELTVKVESLCDKAIARLKLRSARVEDVSLMLYGAGDTSLQLAAAGLERYITDDRKPFELVRAR